jgi:GT2 family glycosyltransferase
MKPLASVYIGIPTYDGRVHKNLATALQKATANRVSKTTSIITCSILTRAFNLLYAHALNERRNGTSHFCLLHDDIVPEPLWLDKMMSLMEREHADVLSVVIPLKDDKGLTSTALDMAVGDEDPHWRVKRLTLNEIYHDYAATFTHEKLLVNTGLMLVDLRKPWVENVWFAFEDRIIPDPKTPGYFKAVGVSEDWFFSRRARELGAKLYATREISVVHTGAAEYSNASPWGSLREDAADE